MAPSEHEADDDDDVREATLAGERCADAPPPRWCGGDETSENEGRGVLDGGFGFPRRHIIFQRPPLETTVIKINAYAFFEKSTDL